MRLAIGVIQMPAIHFGRRIRIRAIAATSLLCLYGGMAMPAVASPAPTPPSTDPRYAFNIEAGRLIDAIIAIGQQSGVNIATTDPNAARVLTPAVKGTMTVDTALHKLLKGSGFVVVHINRTTIRIQRAPVRLSTPRRQDSIPAPVLSPRSAPPPEIVVTSSKQRTPLNTYPGAVYMIELDNARFREAAGRGTQALVDELPILTSTSLGPGREKLFLRGIADSSFTGPTQATVGQYLGEVQLNYNAPDPNLSLYDMKRIEVLPGPQGTLYGIGSLGGIVQLVPRPPILDSWEGEIIAAAGAIAHGGPVGDVAAIVNVPLGQKAAFRLLGYGGRTAGYIDDVGRNLRGVNATSTLGLRGTLRIKPGSRWTIDVGGTFQRIANRDAQYTETTAPPLSRSSLVAQPATNRFALAQITVRKTWDSGLEMVSGVAFIRNRRLSRYDAKGRPGNDLSTIEADNDAQVISAESRLSRSQPDGSSWVIGAHATISDDLLIRTIEGPDNWALLHGVRNQVVNAALFGQVTMRISPRLLTTFGARLSFSKLTGANVLPDRREEDLEVEIAGNGELSLAPSAALAWQMLPDATVYVRYQRGYRLGGYTLGDFEFREPEGRLPYLVFKPDKLDVVEAGVRFDRTGSGVRGAASLSMAHWRDIQADLNGPTGPYTANVGNGRIFGLDMSLTWAVRRDLNASVKVFLAHSELDQPVPRFGRRSSAALPNIPMVTARASLDKRFEIGANTSLTISGNARYVGRSWLGAGHLRIRQGDYVLAGASAELGPGRHTLFFDVQNLFDARGNRFSLGNPLSVSNGTQRTPVQPRTIRFGARVVF